MTLRVIHWLQKGTLIIAVPLMVLGLVGLVLLAPAKERPSVVPGPVHLGAVGGGAPDGYALAAGDVLWVATSAHSTGAVGTNWRTDLEVHNPGTTMAGYSIALLKRNTDNGAPDVRSFTLGPGQSVRYNDIILNVFGFSGAAALRFTTTAGTILITSRTYNNQPGGTYGQYVPAFPDAQAITYSEEGRLIQLGHQPDFSQGGSRSNLGIVNAGAASIDLTIDLYTAAGAWLGQVPVTLRAYEYQQLDQVFSQVISYAIDDGYAILRTSTPTGRFFAYASVIDNFTSDPICIPAAKFARSSSTTPTPTPTTPPPTPTPTPPPSSTVNLMLYTPSGWPGCVVCHYDKSWAPPTQPFLSIYYTTYIFIALANIGTANLTGPVEFGVYIDGTYKGVWPYPNSAGLQAGYYIGLTLTYTDPITAGQHTVTVVVDPNNKIPETTKSDNGCTFTGTWTSIVLAPQQAATANGHQVESPINVSGTFPLGGSATAQAVSNAAGDVLWVATSAHSTGAVGTNWRTDLEVHNPGTTMAGYSIALLKRNTDNGAPDVRSFTLGPGQSVRYNDIILNVFGFSGAAALRFTTTAGTILITSRTYNNQPGGTYGQYVPAFPDAQAITYSEEGRLIQLGHQPDFSQGGSRTNLGIVNAGAASIDLTIDLYTAAGVWLGQVPVSLRAYEYQQLDQVFSQVISYAIDDGYAIVRTSSANGRFFAYASVIDNRTSDPICVPAQKSAPAFVYGPPHSISVNTGNSSEVTDPTTGVIFVFPQGGHGMLTTANIITPPYQPGSDGNGFHSQFTGTELVEFKLPQDAAAETQVWTYGLAHGSFDNGPVKQRWYPWPESSVQAGYLLFDVPDESIAAVQASPSALSAPAATPAPLRDYWIRKITPSSTEGQQKYAFVQQIRLDISAWLSKLSAPLLTAAQAEVNNSFNSTRVYNDPSGGGYIGFARRRIIGASFSPRITLQFNNAPANIVAHETGHLMNHLLVRARLGDSAGDAMYLRIEDLSKDVHGPGDQFYPRTTTTEEVAYLSQYLVMGTIDQINPFDVSTFINYYASGKMPRTDDFPSLEGFTAILLANLTRPTTTMKDWEKKSAEAPVYGATWNDLATIVGMGATNPNEYLANILSERSPGGGSSGTTLAVNAERIGWSYHGFGTVTQAGSPVAGAKVKNIMRLSPSEEYVASETTTDAGGNFYPPRLFPGWSQIHIEKDSAVTDSGLTIDWATPTFDLIPLGSFTLEAPPTPTPTPGGHPTATVSPPSGSCFKNHTSVTLTITATPAAGTSIHRIQLYQVEIDGNYFLTEIYDSNTLTYIVQDYTARDTFYAWVYDNGGSTFKLDFYYTWSSSCP